MITREVALNQCLEACAEYRRQAERERDAREAEAIARDPSLEELLFRRQTIPATTLRRMAAHQGNPRELAQEMRETGKKLNAEIRDRLRALHYPEDYLAVRYRCPRCRDTGYIGNAPATICPCIEDQIRQRMTAEDRATTVTFERFDPLRIPDSTTDSGRNQRRMSLKARNHCETYANAYPDPQPLNLMIAGNSGLGKTFLLQCIGARVQERGGDSVCVTAYHLLQAMKDHFLPQAEAKETEFDRFLTCGMLLIDDLGTEPMLRNITREYLFILLNERILHRRPTVIATNLSPTNLKEWYGDRIASRLLDQNICLAIRLEGKDIRLME